MIFYIILLISYNYSNGETITFDKQLSKIENKIKYIIDMENDTNNILNKIRNEINIQKNKLEKLMQKKLDVLVIEQQNTIDKYNKKREPNEVGQIQSNYIDYTVLLRVPFFSLVLFSLAFVLWLYILLDIWWFNVDIELCTVSEIKYDMGLSRFMG